MPWIYTELVLAIAISSIWIILGVCRLYTSLYTLYKIDGRFYFCVVFPLTNSVVTLTLTDFVFYFKC